MGVEFGLMIVIVLVELWLQKKGKSGGEVKDLTRTESHTDEEFVGVVNDNLNTMQENMKVKKRNAELEGEILKLIERIKGLESMVPEDEDEKSKLKRVSFFISPYKTERYWFETYELFRKLIQTSLVAFLQDTVFPTLSPTIAMNISFVVAFLVVFINPYKKTGDFWFAFVSLVLLIPASQLSVLELSSKQITNGNYGIMGVEFGLMIVIVFVELWWQKKGKSTSGGEVKDLDVLKVTLELSSKQITNGNYGIMGVEFGLMIVIVLVELWWQKKGKSEGEVKDLARTESHTDEEFVGVVNDNLNTMEENMKLKKRNADVEDENSRYRDENMRLKERIKGLESMVPEDEASRDAVEVAVV
eukprot:CAMPEP_0204859512 /NCGR_PEP_ID=MMETSP1347-20130617/23740_1 /ASSEMBLY_ACC=CAM_ASM_000690 /TAXON_ID=215587 /ORGANISM="Aplanochytrium stocchinoi, Strain GSBS06" /LENGTH=358 /DNA_ID=CAMNT_0052008007 /DNA_START=1245 /DNA_END=2322 /DNA_ORIENTATION=-